VYVLSQELGSLTKLSQIADALKKYQRRRLIRSAAERKTRAEQVKKDKKMQ
jgi:hypothetical protein